MGHSQGAHFAGKKKKKHITGAVWGHPPKSWGAARVLQKGNISIQLLGRKNKTQGMGV